MPVALLEHLAASIWHRIADGDRLAVRQGEETLTDYVLLELKRANHPQIQVIKTNKAEEKRKGTDWEWWIGGPRLGWIRFAVQAKRAYGQNYSALKHWVGKKPAGDWQLDILRRYAQRVQAIPLYCLFNHIPQTPVAQSGWNCALPFQPEQLGCTVTPAAVIHHAVHTYGHRNFPAIHTDPRSTPWRCLLRCQNHRAVYADPARGVACYGEVPRIWPSLPRALSMAREIGQLEQAPEDLYPSEIAGLHPPHIIVVDISDL